MTRFAFPWAFLLLLPLLFALWRALRRVCGRGVPFPGLSRMPRIVSWRQRLSALPPILLAAGLACCIVALARPQSDLSRHAESKEVLAIEMAIDVSGSMTEFVPSSGPSAKTRLEAVKETFREFVKKRPDDLIGLVSFGGYATTRCPLTVDHEALLAVLERTNVPGTDGERATADEYQTAIGDGLAMACARLASATNVKSRVTILLSDGVSNTGAVEPDEAAAAAAKLGIRVYTIGVGTHSARTPFRSKDMFGRMSVQYANMSFDESQLKSIAKKTGARYFGVRDKKGLQAALEEIDSLEKTTLDRTVFQRYREYFPPFLLWGVVLVLVAVSLQMMASRRLV